MRRRLFITLIILDRNSKKPAHFLLSSNHLKECAMSVSLGGGLIAVGVQILSVSFRKATACTFKAFFKVKNLQKLQFQDTVPSVSTAK